MVSGRCIRACPPQNNMFTSMMTPTQLHVRRTSLTSSESSWKKKTDIWQKPHAHPKYECRVCCFPPPCTLTVQTIKQCPGNENMHRHIQQKPNIRKATIGHHVFARVGKTMSTCTLKHNNEQAGLIDAHERFIARYVMVSMPKSKPIFFTKNIASCTARQDKSSFRIEEH